MPPKKAAAAIAPTEEEAAPSTREPFFPAAFRHAAVVVVADEDASLAAEEVANQVIQVQTQHHTALTTAAAEHKAAVAAALSAGQPAPRDTTDDTAAAPSVFTKLSFRFTDYAQAKSTVLGFAGSTRDVVGAGKAIKEAHESSTEDGKPADVNEWTLSPSLKALVLLGWIEDQRSKLVREEEDRRLALETEAEAMVVETDAALATAQEAVAAAKEDAAKSAIPSDVKRADVTPEMKQAARDGQKAVSEAEGKLSKLTTQREERIAAKEAVEAHRGDAFSCTLVALISGFSEDVAELAAMNDAGALVHALAWLKPTPAPIGDGETTEPTVASAEPTLVRELRQLASSAGTWQAGVRKIALLEVDVAVPQVEEGEAEGETTPPAIAEGEHAVSPALIAAQRSLVEAIDTLMDTLSAYDTWKAEVHTIAVPEMGPPPELDVYTKMLDGIGNDELSVPVLLHCLVEQVAYTCLDEAELVQANQLQAEAEAARHIEALFAEFAGGVTGTGSATLDTADGVDSAPSPTLNELPLLHQGDTVHHTRVFHSNVTAKGSQVTPSEVEEKMLQLLLLPGVRRYLMPNSPAFSEDDVGRQRTAMAAHCKEGVTVGQLQRYNMLERMVEMLPSNAQGGDGGQVAFKQGILERRHLEDLPLASFAQIFTQAKENYPEMHTTYYPLEDALLVALTAAEPRQETSLSIPRALSFHDYWSKFTAEGGTPITLPLEVYALEEKAASVRTSHELLFRDDASMTRVAGPLDTSVVSQASIVGLRAQPSSIPMVGPTEALDAEQPADKPVDAMVYATYGGAFVSVTRDEQAKGGSMRLQVMTKSGAVTEMTSDGTVLQGHSLRMHDRPFQQPVGGSMADIKASETAKNEVFRCVTADGQVFRNLANGDVQVLLPDGNIAYRDVLRMQWESVNNEGERWVQADPYEVTEEPTSNPSPEAEEKMPQAESPDKKASRPASGAKGKDSKSKSATLPPEEPQQEEAAPPTAVPVQPQLATPAQIPESPLAVTKVMDPDTHATVTARQDLTMRVDYPNQDMLVLFSDGTRISHQPDNYDWQVECEGYATVQRKGSTIAVDIGQGVLSYDLEDRSVTLDMGEWGALLVCGSKVTHAPGNLEAPVQAAATAMGVVQAAFAAFTEMSRLQADWEKTQQDYQAAMDAHAELEKQAAAARAEFEANPPAAPAEGEEPVQAPPLAPPPPAAPVQPTDLVMPSTLYPPTTSSLAGCYLLDVAMGLVAACDERGDGFTVNKEGSVEQFGPRKQMLKRSMFEYEERNRARVMALQPQVVAEADEGEVNPAEEAQVAAEPEPVVEDGIAAKATPEEMAYDTTAAEVFEVDEQAAVAVADGEEEKWAYPYAAGYPPRLFVVYPDGHAAEVLDESQYALYVAKQTALKGCTHTVTQVHSEVDMGVQANTFLVELTHKEIGIIKPLDIALPIPSLPAPSLRAFPSMRGPSTIAPKTQAPPLAIPRIVAVPPQPVPPRAQNAMVYRQVLEYTATDADTLQTLGECLDSYKDWQLQADGTSAETYRVADGRDSGLLAQEASIADAILKARSEFHQQVYSINQQTAAEKAQQQANEVAQEAEAAAAAAAASAAIKPSREHKSPKGILGVRPPVDFFQVEEGLAALSELNNPSSRTLPPNSMRIPTKRMVPLPPVTPPDFPAGASMQGLQSIYPADSFIGTVSPAGGPVVHINTDTENVFSEQSYDTSPAFPDESQNYYDTMSPETAAKMEARRAARNLDATGRPRRAPLDNVPPLYQREQAEPQPNWRFHEIEDSVRRPLHTTSTSAIKARGMRKQFQLSPAHVHFGHVEMGQLKVKTCILTNISPDLGRFFIKPVNAPLSLKYKSGALPAGMAVRIEVRFSPIKVGDFCDEICINTEYHHFVLTVSAKVDAKLQDEPQPAELPVPIMSPVQIDNEENVVDNSPPVLPPTKPELAMQADMEAVELDENATLEQVRERMLSAGRA